MRLFRISVLALLLIFAGSRIFAQSGTANYFANFVFNANGTQNTFIPPNTSFVSWLNNDKSKILIENAPRWETGADPNIPGSGIFGVELGNFTGPELAVGDSVHITFTSTSNNQQGSLVDYCYAIPWSRFPISLYLSQVTLPPTPQNVSLQKNEANGNRTITWAAVGGYSYTLYRRSYEEALPNGTCRMLYHRIAEGLSAGEYLDTDALGNVRYGYILFAVAPSGIMSAHSVEVKEDAEPGSDIDVGFIARLPRIDYVWNSDEPAVEGWPGAGSTVQWQANIKNWNSVTYENVEYHWYDNGNLVDSGFVTLPAGQYTTVELPWTWTFTRHEITFVIDPHNLILEEEEENNRLLIYSNAIGAGFYVEQGMYDYFHQYQKELGVHSNSWEDWAQRHCTRWNQMFANAIFPESPNGVLDRIRIDAIHIVPDGALPLAGGYPTNNPNMNDRTIDLQWGFVTAQLSTNFYENHTNPSDNNPFYFEGSLLHELGHARYLIDCYGFNVHTNAQGSGVGIMENGRLIVNTPFMPLHGDAVYMTPMNGLMNGAYTFVDRYGASALNLIAGHRAIMGNYNSPNNIGIFLQDLPTQNILIVKDGNGNIIPNASIKIYQAGPKAGDWYGKYFDNSPDIDELLTDTEGKVAVGRCPFSNTGQIEHDYGHSTSIAIVRVEKDGLIGYGFIEVTAPNLLFWTGHTDVAEWEVTVDMIDPTSIEEDESVLPSEYRLDQNYPNPFNPETHITFSLPERSKVQVRVFDTLGKLVSVVTSDERSAGKYDIVYAPENASGVYFYQVRAESVESNKQFCETKKMVYLK